MQHLKEIILPNYHFILSLLKYRNVWVFWNKKKSGSNRCSPLNSSIDIYIERWVQVTPGVTLKSYTFSKPLDLSRSNG